MFFWRKINSFLLEFHRTSIPTPSKKQVKNPVLLLIAKTVAIQQILQHLGNRQLLNLTDAGLCSTSPMPATAHRDFEAGSSASLTFSSLAFTADVMVVGLMNWKEGAALLGYCAGNVTSILTRWLLQCTDTVQLLSAASICKTQVQGALETNCKGSSEMKHIHPIILCCILFAVLSLGPRALNRQHKYYSTPSHTLSRIHMDFNNQHKCSCF